MHAILAIATEIHKFKCELMEESEIDIGWKMAKGKGRGKCNSFTLSTNSWLEYVVMAADFAH